MQCPNCTAQIYEEEIDPADPICPECGVTLSFTGSIEDPYDEEDELGGSDDELTQADLDELLRDVDDDDEEFEGDDDEFDEDEEED